MATPFNDAENELMRKIEGAQGSLKSYQTWLYQEEENVESAKKRLSHHIEEHSKYQIRIRDLETELIGYREELRKLLAVATMVSLNASGGKSKLEEDSLDGLESRPRMEKSRAKN